MKRVFAWHSRRRRKYVVAVLTVFACIAGLLGHTFFRCRPVMAVFAESQALWVATKIANQTVATVLQEYAKECDKAITVTYDNDHKISSVGVNTAAVNSVRTAITDRVMTAMEEQASLSVSLPTGTLLGWDWLSGFGPLITFPVGYTATVISNVSSALVAEGINQSMYRVLVHLEISLYIVSAGGRSTVGTQVSYPMAETVLLGEVPDNLTEVYGDDQSVLGKIFDYGTTQ